MKVGFQDKRTRAVARLPEFDTLRDQSRDIKNHVLEHLDLYLERFEDNVTANGGKVHWCRTPGEARDAIVEICRSVDAKIVTKGKSMIAEEIELNDHLEKTAWNRSKPTLASISSSFARKRPATSSPPPSTSTRRTWPKLHEGPHHARPSPVAGGAASPGQRGARDAARRSSWPPMSASRAPTS